MKTFTIILLAMNIARVLVQQSKEKDQSAYNWIATIIVVVSYTLCINWLISVEA